MGRTKDLWISEYERACEDFASDGDEALFRSRLSGLGFAPHEVAEKIDLATEEQS